MLEAVTKTGQFYRIDPESFESTFVKDLGITFAAISYNPTAIIINLPSNDSAEGYTLEEQMGNYITLFDFGQSYGVYVWIATPQPVNYGPVVAALQMAVRDSIFSQFDSKAIDFWTTLANEDGTINPLYNVDGTHLNDAGHKLVAESIFDYLHNSAWFRDAVLMQYNKLEQNLHD